jgi:hypothetical protein
VIAAVIPTTTHLHRHIQTLLALKTQRHRHQPHPPRKKCTVEAARIVLTAVPPARRRTSRRVDEPRWR